MKKTKKNNNTKSINKDNKNNYPFFMQVIILFDIIFASAFIGIGFLVWSISIYHTMTISKLLISMMLSSCFSFVIGTYADKIFKKNES